MALLKPEKIDLSFVNDGKEYDNGQILNAEIVNSIIKSTAYSQCLATNQPDNSQANKTGKPTVTIENRDDGTPVFQFHNLKGEKGDSGISNAVLSNEVGNSDENGYTQKATNSIISNPNFLLNGDFSINQRGKDVYGGKENSYCVDRWKLQESTLTFNVAEKSLSNSGSSSAFMLQKFDEADTEKLKGKTVTISASIENVIYSKKINIPQNPEKNLTIEPAVPIPNGVLYLYCYSSGLIGFVVGVSALSSIKLDYVKLEFGSIATPNSPKNYLQELSECQKYYNIIDGRGDSAFEYGFAFAYQIYASGGGKVLVYLPLGVNMRTTPNVTAYGDFKLLAPSTVLILGIKNTDIEDCKIIQNQAVLTIDIASTKTIENVPMMFSSYLTDTTYIEFDSEIYL